MRQKLEWVITDRGWRSAEVCLFHKGEHTGVKLVIARSMDANQPSAIGVVVGNDSYLGKNDGEGGYLDALCFSESRDAVICGGALFKTNGLKARGCNDACAFLLHAKRDIDDILHSIDLGEDSPDDEHQVGNIQ